MKLRQDTALPWRLWVYGWKAVHRTNSETFYRKGDWLCIAPRDCFLPVVFHRTHDNGVPREVFA
jgi:hypothetical protein